jgi:hypothetical protein
VAGQGGDNAVRWLPLPDVLSQLVVRKHNVRRHEQPKKQKAPSLALYAQLAGRTIDLQRSQQSEVHPETEARRAGTLLIRTTADGTGPSFRCTSYGISKNTLRGDLFTPGAGTGSSECVAWCVSRGASPTRSPLE